MVVIVVVFLARQQPIAGCYRDTTPRLAGYVVLIVAGLVLPVLAVIGYLAIAGYVIVPFPAIKGRGIEQLTNQMCRSCAVDDLALQGASRCRADIRAQPWRRERHARGG